MNKTNPTREAGQRYIVQFSLVMAGYVLILIGTRAAGDHLTGISRLVATFLPALPMAGLFIVVIRWLRDTDEFKRRNIVNSLAIAGSATALFCVTYGFGEGDPLPRPSAWLIWSVFMIAWLIAAMVIRFRYR